MFYFSERTSTKLSSKPKELTFEQRYKPELVRVEEKLKSTQVNVDFISDTVIKKTPGFFLAIYY